MRALASPLHITHTTIRTAAPLVLARHCCLRVTYTLQLPPRHRCLPIRTRLVAVITINTPRRFSHDDIDCSISFHVFTRYVRLFGLLSNNTATPNNTPSLAAILFNAVTTQPWR